MVPHCGSLSFHQAQCQVPNTQHTSTRHNRDAVPTSPHGHDAHHTSHMTSTITVHLRMQCWVPNPLEWGTMASHGCVTHCMASHPSTLWLCLCPSLHSPPRNILNALYHFFILLLLYLINYVHFYLWPPITCSLCQRHNGWKTSVSQWVHH